MKRLTALILCALILLCLPACSEAKAADYSSPEKTTVMVYMIGSDLESKSGAASEDLNEIRESKIDISKNDVVIYTGGTTAWQNDILTQGSNSIISLTSNGYVVEKDEQQASMGDAATLSGFLDYCVENHPADRYALVLWDHGNGPLIGYGKDTLFGNDSLNLEEMASAMQNSPFSADKKLQWVGFDACLMASAELACVWSPYAEYLIASQEVEPAFGWDYSFLKDVGKSDISYLLDQITEKYLDTCLRYFEKKGYTGRETTLSVTDLSYCDKLASALNGLFEDASKDVSDKYDNLSSKRVNTRSLGRASTGSEYDLVDLRDLCAQLSSDYPERTKEVIDVVDAMVVDNSTNAENLCGLSLYYPFYNKSYYENSWCDTYNSMGLFTGYLDYLTAFQVKWLGTDMQDDYASSETPSAETSERYTLQLTDDQAEHFASAKYYILKKEGAETFTNIYSSSNVEYDDSILTAEFDGNVIYAHNSIDKYLIPQTTEYDTVGDYTNYATPVVINNSKGVDILSSNSDEEKQEVITKKCRCLIAADKANSTIEMSAMMPYDTDQTGTDMMGGKTEELDLSEFTTYQFLEKSPRTITRDDNGVIRSMDEWRSTNVIRWTEWSVADGLDFIYAPLGYGSYSLVFEICDTQGSMYCSEPIDIDTSNVEWLTANEKSSTVIESDGTFPVLLKEDDDFALYLDKADDSGTEVLTVLAENKSDKKLRYSVDNVICNKNIDCSDGYGISSDIAAGERTHPYSSYFTTSLDSFNYGVAAEIGALKQISSISFSVSLVGYDNKKTMWNNDRIEVDFKKGSEYTVSNTGWFSEPLLEDDLEDPFGAVVKPQVIVDEPTLKVELLCFGKQSTRLTGALRFTNLSEDKYYVLTSDGFAIDDIYISCPAGIVELAPGMIAYRDFSCNETTLDQFNVTGLQELTISLRSAINRNILWQGYGSTEWIDLKLDKKSDSPSQLNDGIETLMDNSCTTVDLLRYELDKYGKKIWYMSLESKNEEGVEVRLVDFNVNGQDFTGNDISAPVFQDEAQAGPGQKSVFKLSSSAIFDSDIKPEDITDVSFRIIVYNFTGDKILYEGKTTVSVKADDDTAAGMTEAVTDTAQ